MFEYLFLLIIFLLIYVPPLYWLGRVVKRSPDKRNRVVAVVLMIAYIIWPFWDIPLDRYRFHKICDEQAGLFVYRRVALPERFYIPKGMEMDKGVRNYTGGWTLRKVNATGNELDMDVLNARYGITTKVIFLEYHWGKVLQSTTTISDQSEVVGKVVSLKGGAGYFVEVINTTPSHSGFECPKRDSKETNYKKKLLKEVFYKSTD